MILNEVNKYQKNSKKEIVSIQKGLNNSGNYKLKQDLKPSLSTLFEISPDKKYCMLGSKPNPSVFQDYYPNDWNVSFIRLKNLQLIGSINGVNPQFLKNGHFVTFYNKSGCCIYNLNTMKIENTIEENPRITSFVDKRNSIYVGSYEDHLIIADLIKEKSYEIKGYSLPRGTSLNSRSDHMNTLSPNLKYLITQEAILKLNNFKLTKVIPFQDKKEFFHTKFSSNSKYVVIEDNIFDLQQERKLNNVSGISPFHETESLVFGSDFVTYNNSSYFINDSLFLSLNKNPQSDFANNFSLWNLETEKKLLEYEASSPINYFRFIKEANRIYTLDINGLIKIWDLKHSSPIVTINIQNKNSFIIYTPDNYYYTNSRKFDHITFVNQGQELPPSLFDLKYNRPDIVFARLGYASLDLIKKYKKAYMKRLKKLGFKEKNLSEEFHVPVTVIENIDQLPPIIDVSEISLNINFKDSKYKLDQYNIWINDVPLSGVKGKDLKMLKTDSFSITETITLSQGKNKMQVSCLNEKGAESYKKTVEIEYEPIEHVKPNLYLVCVGVSDYADNKYDLTYADKDGRDLIEFYTTNSTMYENIYVDSLFNSAVTLENVRTIKTHLQQSKVDDHVVMLVSGHGVLDEYLDFYFATHNTNFSNPSQYGVLYDEFEDLLDSIPSRNKMLLIDACHSGEIDKDEVTEYLALNTVQGEIEFLKGDAERQIKINELSEIMNTLFVDIRSGNGATVLTAAKGDEYAEESAKLKNGVFTYTIINGLKNNVADKDCDNKITVSELRAYVIEQVARLTEGRQKPTSRQENIEFDYRVW